MNVTDDSLDTLRTHSHHCQELIRVLYAVLRLCLLETILFGSGTDSGFISKALAVGIHASCDLHNCSYLFISLSNISCSAPILGLSSFAIKCYSIQTGLGAGKATAQHALLPCSEYELEKNVLVHCGAISPVSTNHRFSADESIYLTFDFRAVF